MLNMFTGLVQCVGLITAVEDRGGDRRLFVDASGLGEVTLAHGESVAVNGVCLTVTVIERMHFGADVSLETLGLTTLGASKAGDRVNLERSLVLGQALGGHLVTGHVDAIGEVASIKGEARSSRLELRLPRRLLRYVAAKGSICIDGVSLTVNHISGDRVGVNIVPHTLQVTTLGQYRPGTRINIEVDIIARYLERLIGAGEAAQGLIDSDRLARMGFGKEET